MKLQYFYFAVKVDRMSFFLLPNQQTERILLNQYRNYAQKELKDLTTQLTQKQNLNLERQAKKLGEQCEQVILQNSESKRLSVIIGNTLPNHKNLITIQFNKLTRHIRIKMDLLTSNSTYFRIQNTRYLAQLTIKIRKFLKIKNIKYIQTSFNMANGKFRMLFPLYAGSQDYFNRIISKGQSLIEYIYKNYVINSLPILKFIVSEDCQEFEVESHPTINNLDSAQRYLDMCHVRTHFTQSSIIPEQWLIQMEKRRRFDLEQSVKNEIKQNQSFYALNSIYQFHIHSKFFGFSLYNGDISHEEEKNIINKIGMPVQTKPKLPAQNNLIVNHVYVCNLPSVRLKKVDEGGFSSIFKTDIKYLCVYPTPGYQMLRFNHVDLSNHKDVLTKSVIIKKEDDRCSFSRNRHQIQILKSIKEPSIFLPKYYIFLNKPNPHSNAVVMDHIPFQNLTQFMRNNLRSMTLRTKLVVIFAIIQALRFLRDQRIVHLDIKPSNIMIYHNFLVKLIDFGESYHPDICQKKHKPGFSIPYSSPEIFNNEANFFTSKSDVFSLGVIMFQMFYRSYPYDIFEPTELIDEIMQNYLKKWLFVPEQFERCGDVKVLRIMNACISKCLSPQIEHRPQLDWLAIIVRCCIEYIQ